MCLSACFRLLSVKLCKFMSCVHNVKREGIKVQFNQVQAYIKELEDGFCWLIRANLQCWSILC